ncbi:formyltransferase family protein [Aquirufa salirivi]|uniref:Formyltransferase family protein n=1 Tax=Aquirufa salirivi TaxID=3104729 RepID=A0ABW8RTJ5_9BACT
MKIQILVDNPNSWIIPYAERLLDTCKSNGFNAILLFNHDEVEEGDILCLLSCEKKFSKLNLNKHNLVVHESYLPLGKGWSPVSWQILEGKNEIPITLFEATDEIDTGDIYLQETIKLEGHELIDEIRQAQGEATISIILNFLTDFGNIIGKVQTGESTFYKRRKSKDSRLDINESIKSQFNLLRTVDNERYPAFFELNGHFYKISIEKMM